MVVMISSRRPSTMALVAPLRLAIEGSPPTIWKPRPDGRQHRLHGDRRRGHGHDLGDDHGPAGEPADHVTAEATCPLVDRAGDRVATRQLGEAQGDHQLPDEDRRPGPEEERPGEAEPETEQLEDGGQDRDEREPRRERRVRADRAVQILAVPELVEVVGRVVSSDVGSAVSVVVAMPDSLDDPRARCAHSSPDGSPGLLSRRGAVVLAE